MSISIKEVEHVAKLARLALSEDEKVIYSEQLSKIIDNFNELAKVNTDEIETLDHALPLLNVTREDEVASLFDRETLMKNAPDTENGFFRVPKI